MTTHDNKPLTDPETESTTSERSDDLNPQTDPTYRTADTDLDADDRRTDTDLSADPDLGRDTGSPADADLGADNRRTDSESDDARRTDGESGDGERRTEGSGDLSEEPLVAADAVVDFRARWEVIQQGFVDDPRNAVTEADKLVDDLLKRLSATFDEQHQALEGQWSDGEPSTEDLRSALQKYRAFFQRLLTL